MLVFIVSIVRIVIHRRNISEPSCSLERAQKKHKNWQLKQYIIPQYNHNFDFNSAKMLTYIHNKNLRRIFEAAAISFFNSLNTRPGFYNISPNLSKYILDSYNIFHPKLIFSTYIIILMFSIFLFVFLSFLFLSFSFSSF